VADLATLGWQKDTGAAAQFVQPYDDLSSAMSDAQYGAEASDSRPRTARDLDAFISKGWRCSWSPYEGRAFEATRASEGRSCAAGGPT
jgi:hypothetical protein